MYHSLGLGMFVKLELCGMDYKLVPEEEYIRMLVIRLTHPPRKVSISILLLSLLALDTSTKTKLLVKLLLPKKSILVSCFIYSYQKCFIWIQIVPVYLYNKYTKVIRTSWHFIEDNILHALIFNAAYGYGRFLLMIMSWQILM